MCLDPAGRIYRAVVVENFTLNNGVTIPPVGFGVFQTPPEETAATVAAALEVGYRHIDTAAGYFNEAGVGEGLRRSGIPRSEVFVATKIWPSDYGYERTLHGFTKAARKLQVDRIDLLMLHHPGPERFDDTIGSYRALEKLLADGSVRAIGVSNFLHHHMRTLLGAVSVVPAVNQIEVHPYFPQQGVVANNDGLGIRTVAWSPLGGITFYWGEKSKAPQQTLDDPLIREVAARHGRSPAQIMLRWNLQQGRAVIPKTVRRERMVENLAVFDFDLTAGELAAINDLDLGVRGGADPDDTGNRFEIMIPEAS